MAILIVHTATKACLFVVIVSHERLGSSLPVTNAYDVTATCFGRWFLDTMLVI